MTKLKNSNCDKAQILKWGKNSKTQIVTKLQNSECDETQKFLEWQKLKNSNCDKTQFMTKPKNSNSDKTLQLKL